VCKILDRTCLFSFIETVVPTASLISNILDPNALDVCCSCFTIFLGVVETVDSTSVSICSVACDCLCVKLSFSFLRKLSQRVMKGSAMFCNFIFVVCMFI